MPMPDPSAPTPPTADLDERLRSHLDRVAAGLPAVGFEQRVLAHVAAPPRPAAWRLQLGVVTVVLVAVTMLVLLTTGHQVDNVFSNISNGLAG